MNEMTDSWPGQMGKRDHGGVRGGKRYVKVGNREGPARRIILRPLTSKSIDDDPAYTIRRLPKTCLR